MTDFGNVIHRTDDDSYVIYGGAYHVPNEGDYAGLWLDVKAYAEANPDKVYHIDNSAEPVLTEEQLAERRRLSETNFESRLSALEDALAYVAMSVEGI